MKETEQRATDLITPLVLANDMDCNSLTTQEGADHSSLITQENSEFKAILVDAIEAGSRLDIAQTEEIEHRDLIFKINEETRRITQKEIARLQEVLKSLPHEDQPVCQKLSPH